ncbi:MAG TPA: DUF695 domain-containing protein [Thermoanaerobaculia bacterium]|jgi:hypothetical protein
MPQQDRWAIAHAEEDGMPILFRYRNQAPVKDTTQFPFLVSILWIYEGDADTGMPGNEVLREMERFEDALDSIDDSSAGFLMVAVTGNDRREWIWYTSDTNRFMALLNAALKGRPKFPLDLSASEDPAWLTYLTIRESSNRRGTDQ